MMNDKKKDVEEQIGQSTGPTLFKKRNKIRGNLASSNTSSNAGSSRKAFLQEEEEEQEWNDDSGPLSGQSVLRSNASRRGRRFNQPTGTSIATRDGRRPINEKGTNLQLERNDAEASNTTAVKARRSNLVQSLVLPSSLSQSSIGNDVQTDSVYTPASLAALKAATPNRKNIVDNIDEKDGYLQAAHEIMNHQDMSKDRKGESSASEKYDVEIPHDGIPSEAVIQAAKEKRRRALQEVSKSDDFISIDEEGPHPDSRLVREDDQIGSGEEEFAEFTGATERIALDEDGIQREKTLERQRRKEEVEGEIDEEMSDDSGKEWEEAQMKRETTKYASRRPKSQIKERDRSPFRPAPIPQATPLPGLTSTSSRLQDKIVSLQSEIKNQDTLYDHSAAQLAQLQKDEERNKSDTENGAEREAWFREFEEFIVSLATFLEEKVPKLEDVETDWIGHLVLRTKMIQQARADALTDQLSLFRGVPSSSLLPDTAQDVENAPRPPIENGDALSAIRQARRAFADEALRDELSSADQASFQIAQHEIARLANGLLDDVQAAEYREPAERTIQNGDQGQHSILHPSSLVARFHRWRRIYPQDYSNAWGGLTLASIWDFWIKKSLCGWDMMRLKDQRENSFDQFKWYTDIIHYTHKAQQQLLKNDQHDDEMKQDEEENIASGGDDEMIAHAFTNTIIPVLNRIVDKGAFDPWNRIDNSSALELIEQMTYVLEKDHIRFQSLITSFLRLFHHHIIALVNAFIVPPAAQAPSMASDAPYALFQCVQYITNSIVQNLIGWHRYVLASQRPFLQEMMNELIGKVIIPLLDMAKQIAGGKEVVKEIVVGLLRRTARPALLNDHVRGELERMQKM